MVDIKLATGQPALEHVTAGAPVRGDEVEVVSGDVQPLRVVWKPEAHEAARDLAKLEGRLILDDLYEGRVGPALAGHAARLDVIEASVHPDGATRRATTDDLVQVVTKGLEIHRHGKRSRRIRLEDGHHGERGSSISVDGIGSTIRLYLVEAAVETDHLSVEGVERAEAEISTTLELSEADVALVFSLHKGVDGRSLEERVVEVFIPSEVLLPEILDVQRTYQRAIDWHQAHPAFVTIKPAFRLFYGLFADPASCGRQAPAHSDPLPTPTDVPPCWEPAAIPMKAAKYHKSGLAECKAIPALRAR